ncbi:type III-B CRISPR module-associated protein Cmr5 [Candidatus Electrothrix sp.]|uniref:type III-B CRISPR module-associated protein Cmr5 n=1 Tax=Candidatus Electrothrix sp. TaxID=2170559 RepID=UPI004056AC20
MQTRQQQDALQALEDVQNVLEQEEEFKKSYATAVHRFPFLIRQNGLQQTLAFYAGKAHAKAETGQNTRDTAEGLFLDHILATLNLNSEPDQVNILKDLARADLQSYMRHTRRCLEVALWYRRFVESVLKIDATGTSIEETTDRGNHDGD